MANVPEAARVLMLVENQSAPFDRRVWQEALALARAGHEVTVVSPRGRDRDREAHQRIDGIDVWRFRAPLARSGKGYLCEYPAALVAMTRLARRLHARAPFDVVHVSNPPDLLFLAAGPLLRRGAKLVFDHHDPVPELYRSRFGRAGLVHRILLAAERQSMRRADLVLAPNEGSVRIAEGRARVEAGRVVVVRNGPDLQRLAPVPGDPALRRGRRHLLCYVGIMGPQDGVDLAVRCVAALVAAGRDVHCILVGDGGSRAGAERLAASLRVHERTEFAGLLDWSEIAPIACTADVCLASDPASPFNHVATQNKIVEYMALGRPVACFDLRPARVLAGAAAAYARPSDPLELARVVAALLDDPERRVAMGVEGRTRVEQRFAWEHGRAHLLEAYERLLATGS
jgi:glycosyltransferase involved in cell wall biosynthesis